MEIHIKTRIPQYIAYGITYGRTRRGDRRTYVVPTHSGEHLIGRSWKEALTHIENAQRFDSTDEALKRAKAFLAPGAYESVPRIDELVIEQE